MGEIYRAKDTKLNRDVAIRVVPGLFAQDADRLARFTRDAQMLAALNHPNIHDLLYQSADQIMAASYTVNGDTFVAEKPRAWIAKPGGTQWDLAPDGKRVAVLTPVESADAPKQEHEVVFLQNFFDELRRRVPVGK